MLFKQTKISRASPPRSHATLFQQIHEPAKHQSPKFLKRAVCSKVYSRFIENCDTMTKGFSSQSKRNLPRITILLLLLVIFLATYQKNCASNKNWNASKKIQLAKNDLPDSQTISSVLHSTLPHYNLMEEISGFRKSAKQTSYSNKCGLGRKMHSMLF